MNRTACACVQTRCCPIASRRYDLAAAARRSLVWAGGAGLDSRVPWRVSAMLRRVPLAACISLAAAMTVVAYAPVVAQSQSQSGTRVDGRPRVATAPPQAAVNETSRTEAMAPAESAPSETAPSEAAPSETMAPVPPETPPETPSATPPGTRAEPPAQTTSPAPAETVVEVDPVVAQVRQRLATAKIGDATSAERAALKAF